ncbi:MAG: class I SAM-dependent methyltransferase [Ferruginibacter sp.]
MEAYNQEPIQVIKAKHKEVSVFSTDVENIDAKVVEGFGEEWSRFNNFDEDTFKKMVSLYFDILDDKIVNKNSYAIDIGCGTGRQSKHIAKIAKFVECVDPSKAIYAADVMLKDANNVRLTQASTESLPFPDETFDFAMSIGVLHHIPNTEKAMMDCVKKVKKGGYFYCYLYYNLDNRSFLYKLLFQASHLVRLLVSRLPNGIKKVVCDILAVVLYMPWVLLARFFVLIGMRNFAKKIPLAAYEDKSFFVIRNDSLDRFGTSLEQRFSKKEVFEMMTRCGLTDIVISPKTPYYHAVGKRI